MVRSFVKCQVCKCVQINWLMQFKMDIIFNLSDCNRQKLTMLHIAFYRNLCNNTAFAKRNVTWFSGFLAASSEHATHRANNQPLCPSGTRPSYVYSRRATCFSVSRVPFPPLSNKHSGYVSDTSRVEGKVVDHFIMGFFYIQREEFAPKMKTNLRALFFALFSVDGAEKCFARAPEFPRSYN